MRNEGARDKLLKQGVSMTEEKVKEAVAWMRSKGIGRVRYDRKRRTPLREFKEGLASMTNDEVTEMVAGTQQKPPRYLVSLIRLPGSTPRAVAKMVGWQPKGKGSR